MNCEKLINTVVRVTRDIWNKGWTEANGGNISVRLDDKQKDSFKQTAKDNWLDLPRQYSELGGEIILISRTGTYLRNIELDPLENIGFVKISEDGSAYSIVEGFSGGGRPTSEFSSHLGTHAFIKNIGGHVVLHNHATNLMTLTFVEQLTTQRLSKLIWQMQTESIVVLPGGIEFVPWLVPGSLELGDRTAQALGKRPVAIWQYHGVLAIGEDLDQALGRIHVAEKAAEIYLKAKAAGGVHSAISDDQLLAMAKEFNLDYDKQIMATETGL